MAAYNPNQLDLVNTKIIDLMNRRILWPLSIKKLPCFELYLKIKIYIRYVDSTIVFFVFSVKTIMI